MINKLLYLCPACTSEDSLEEDGSSIICKSCHQHFSHQNNKIAFNGKSYSIAAFYLLIRKKLPSGWMHSSTEYYTSQRAILRQGIKQILYKGFEGEYSKIEVPEEIDEGVLILNNHQLKFKGKHQDHIFPRDALTSFSTNSNYFEFKVKGRPFYQIRFVNESPLKYEDLFTNWINETDKSRRMVEHQPKIIYSEPKSVPFLLSYEQITEPGSNEKFSTMEYILHLLIGKPITAFFKWKADLTFHNQELIPKQGPFIMIMNHESYLDPILISTLSPRRIGFFTKSTSFADRILQHVFRAYRCLPTRRYEVDPHVIRRALKRLKSGHAVGVFPEGERTWDGQLLGFKYNTVRLLMSAQVPIVMVKISGAYDVLPRWSHRINKGVIRVSVDRCFSLVPGLWQTTQLKETLEKYYRESSGQG